MSIGDWRCFGCGANRKNTAACANCGRVYAQEPTDDEFWSLLLDEAHWLFYGDLDPHFGPFVVELLSHSFDKYGFGDVPMSPDRAVAYWLFLSELVALDLAEYGTSPRGAWLTPDGERFKRIVTERHATGTLSWSPSDL